MAYVAKGPQTRTDHYLDYLLAEWHGLPEVEEEWSTWDEHERLLFVLEWPIRQDRLCQLEAWAAEGALTPEQLERYHELQTLVAKHRPVLARLLAEPDDRGSMDGLA